MKKKFRPLWASAMVLFAMSLLYTSCKKSISPGSNIPPGTTKFSVYLADDPANFQRVLIDIQQIQVKIDTCLSNSSSDTNFVGCDGEHDERHSNCEIWDTLDINPGIYDLLTLSNGMDTLLANGFFPSGKIERIKFTLGARDSVEVDSVVYPLNLLNNRDFVYVNLERRNMDSLSSNNFQMYLDFDLDHSIRYFFGKYWLTPVLRPFGLHSTGGIFGMVRPVHSFGFIKAYNATDSGFALPRDEGEFKIRGLNPGTYSLTISGKNGYQDTTITNISVLKGDETTVGTINLHQ